MPVRINLVPILPKRKSLFDIPAGHAASERALKDLAEEAKGLFEKTVETWDNKPSFTVNVNQGNVTVGTRSKIYQYVDKGTSAHVIRARNKPVLRFGVGGGAKTKVRTISSFKGSKGDVWVSKTQVNHPGGEAREFSVIIQERIQKKFPAKFKAVIKAYKTGEAPGV